MMVLLCGEEGNDDNDFRVFDLSIWVSIGVVRRCGNIGRFVLDLFEFF